MYVCMNEKGQVSLVDITVDRAMGPGGTKVSSTFCLERSYVFIKVRVAAKLGIPSSRFLA